MVAIACKRESGESGFTHQSYRYRYPHDDGLPAACCLPHSLSSRASIILLVLCWWFTTLFALDRAFFSLLRCIFALSSHRELIDLVSQARREHFVAFIRASPNPIRVPSIVHIEINYFDSCKDVVAPRINAFTGTRAGAWRQAAARHAASRRASRAEPQARRTRRHHRPGLSWSCCMHTYISIILFQLFVIIHICS